MLRICGMAVPAGSASINRAVGTAGTGFLDAVLGHVHIARNEGRTAVTVVQIYLNVPPGGSQRIDAPAPGNCAIGQHGRRRPARGLPPPGRSTHNLPRTGGHTGRPVNRPWSQRQRSSEQQVAGAADATLRLGCPPRLAGAGARFSAQEIASTLTGHRSSGGCSGGAAQPSVSVSVSFAPRPGPFTSGRPGHVRAGHGRWRTLVNAGERWPALLESVLGQPLRSSNLLSSATLTCKNIGE